VELAVSRDETAIGAEVGLRVVQRPAVLLIGPKHDPYPGLAGGVANRAGLVTRQLKRVVEESREERRRVLRGVGPDPVRVARQEGLREHHDLRAPASGLEDRLPGLLDAGGQVE